MRALSALVVGWCALSCACTESPAHGRPPPDLGVLTLRQRLMEGKAELLIDPAYVERPFRGLVRYRVGADVYGKTIPGTYVASLFDRSETSQFDVRRAWLLRGTTRVRVPEVEVQPGDVLAFSLGRLRPVLPRGALRPQCSLAVDVWDSAGKRLDHREIPLGPELESTWLDQQVPLDAGAGQVASIDVRLDGFWCSSDDHALLGDVQLYSRQRPAPSRPNVLVIWVDKLRADLAQPETGIPGHMPFLHSLVDQGVLFTHARANSNNTFRSTVQALTSDPNSEAIAGEYFTTGLAAPMGVPSLPSVLGAAGYHTTCLGANIHIARVPDGASRRQVDLGFDRCSIDYRTIPGDNDDARIEREQLVPWLESELREPFFLNLHYDGAHEPYPEVDKKHLPEHFAKYLERGQGDPQAALYLYKAELFDRVLRETFDRLQAKGLLDRTLVVLASDHGSTLGPDHRFFMFGRFTDIRATHAGGLYDEQVRTLLLFLHPTLTRARRDENVELLDLAPTILDFLGIEAPTQFMGRSRLAALRGGAALPDAPMVLAKELEYMYGLFDAPYKYIYWLKPQERWPIDTSYVPGWNLNKVDDTDHEQFTRQIRQYRAKGMPIGDARLVVSELFDVDADPREIHDLASERPELVQAFQARLEKTILNQRVPEYALDEARETIAFASPEHALYEGTIESDGPLVLSSPLSGCDPWLSERRDLNTIRFRCGVASRLAGVTFYRRTSAELRFAIQRDGVPLAPRDFFLGPDGLPSNELTSRGDVVVLAPSAQPRVSPRTPEIVAQRDRGAFVYRQLRPAGTDEGTGQEELSRAFAAWGYRQ